MTQSPNPVPHQFAERRADHTSRLPVALSIIELIDQHIAWLGLWHQMLLFPDAPRAEQAAALPLSVPSESLEHHAPNSPEAQPAYEKITVHVGALHTFARLVLNATPMGGLPDRKDYDAVIAKHSEVLRALRRIERAFGAASAALDPLTGLRNRHGMMDDLLREYGRFMRNGTPYCIAIMDIDFFKKINDTHGHDAGDAVLKIVASHITRTLRVYDDVYRMGGEEFLMCLKDTDLETGHKVLDRMRAGLQNIIIPLDNGTIINVTASFGIASVTPARNAEDTMRAADTALYAAKKAGRNQVKMA